jgi:anti-anti-sigma factor
MLCGVELGTQLGGRDETVLIVRAPRELGHEEADELRLTVARHLPNRDGAAVVLDMADVVLISSIGIAALLQTQELCEDREASMVIANMPAEQMGLLTMLRLDRKFTMFESVEDACAALG